MHTSNWIKDQTMLICCLLRWRVLELWDRDGPRFEAAGPSWCGVTDRPVFWSCGTVAVAHSHPAGRVYFLNPSHVVI